MILIIIFAIVTLCGVAILVANKVIYDFDSVTLFASGFAALVGGIVMLVVLIPLWLQSHIQSEITYDQLVAQKAIIEQAIDTNREMDRVNLLSEVIEYNEKVIECRTASARPIIGQFYSDKVDWQSLETIDWYGATKGE